MPIMSSHSRKVHDSPMSPIYAGIGAGGAGLGVNAGAGRLNSLLVSHPVRNLTIAFCLWKVLLFFVIVACPSPGYDTSTTLLSVREGQFPSFLLNFVRWDSIYFVHVAEYGYVFEQEWAFGYGYTRFLSVLASGTLFALVLANCHVYASSSYMVGYYPSEANVNCAVVRRSLGDLGLGGGEASTTALVGVVTSHIAHYLSVLTLYRFSINVFGKDTVTKKLVCFLSSALHIICPAGAFLSAPYGESLFSLLNFSGFYVYSSSLIDRYDGRGTTSAVKRLLAAVLFSLATLVRSNGILSGFLFAYDATVQLWNIASHGVSLDDCVHLSVIVVGGFIVGLGMIFPQVLAYMAYCTSDAASRPWCQRTLPSIYSWSQGQYWNVGFLRYWTFPNLPLFLLALPTLALLCQSSLWSLKMTSMWGRTGTDISATAVVPIHFATRPMLLQLAVSQGLLAMLAFTSYHVQIINRLSSGYPLWYWYLVSLAFGRSDASKHEHHFHPGRSGTFALAVRVIVIYGLIQGVLFGSFLPPA